MQLTDYINILVYLLVLLILSPVLGKYIAHVFDQDRIGWIESKIYQSCVIDIKGQTARGYLKDILNVLRALFCAHRK